MDTRATTPTGDEGERRKADEPCPDSETLAAFVDGQLVGAERDRVALHVTGCDDCLLVVGDTAAFLGSDSELAVSVPAPDPPVAWWRRPQVVVPGGLLAAAAVGFLAFRLTAPPARPSVADDPTLATLAASEMRLAFRDPALEAQSLALFEVLSARPTSARLAGASYLPPPRVTRSAVGSGVPLDVLAAAARLEEATAGRDDWRARWARGLAQLAGDRLDEAAASLESARPAEDVDAATTTALDVDRAAVHLARAERTGNHEAARQALALSDGVLARDSTSLPALFNRALALEYLDRQDDAAAAWRAYLARDADSPWADEIRQRHLR